VQVEILVCKRAEKYGDEYGDEVGRLGGLFTDGLYNSCSDRLAAQIADVV
jgi:hypothetical protein